MKKILLSLAVVLSLVANVASAADMNARYNECAKNKGTWSNGHCSVHPSANVNQKDLKVEF